MQLSHSVMMRFPHSGLLAEPRYEETVPLIIRQVKREPESAGSESWNGGKPCCFRRLWDKITSSRDESRDDLFVLGPKEATGDINQYAPRFHQFRSLGKKFRLGAAKTPYLGVSPVPADFWVPSEGSG